MASPRQTGAVVPGQTAAAALVAAAGELLSEAPPSAISGRRIARRAGVPYGLLHRHFESKSAVLGEAAEKMLDEFMLEAFDDEGAPVPLAMSAHPALWRALVHLALDESEFGRYRHATPVIDRTVTAVARLRPDLDRLQVRAVTALALSIEIGVPLHREVLVGPCQLVGDTAVDGIVAGWLDGLYRGTCGPLSIVPSAVGTRPRAVARVERSPDASSESRLVEAGALLLAEHSPSAISGRTLAATAGVNYGLIHHYFGTKDEVLRRAIELHRDRFYADHMEPNHLPRFFSTCDYPGYVRAQTWAAIDPSVNSARFPVVDEFVARHDRPGMSPDRARATRVAILVTIASQLTWAVFQPVMHLSFGLDPRQLEPLAASLLRNLLVDPMAR